MAEGVDSYLNPDSVNSIIVPITNVMNDQYIGAFVPYSYIKGPKDKHQLIVDPRPLKSSRRFTRCACKVRLNFKREGNATNKQNAYVTTYALFAASPLRPLPTFVTGTKIGILNEAG